MKILDNTKSIQKEIAFLANLIHQLEIHNGKIHPINYVTMESSGC